MNTINDYTYEVINNETDARICAQLLAEEFATHNSLSIFDQYDSQRIFDDDAWPLLADTYNERLSFLVRYRQTGEIIATICNNDLYLSQQKQPYDPSSPASPYAFFDLLDDLDERFIHEEFGQELKLNKVLKITMGATRAAHSGNGIGTHLRKIMLIHARETKGFQYALAQTTNEATQHIYVNKLGGKVLSVLDPATWIWKKEGGQSRPYKDYKGGSIPNILLALSSI
ncbi:hypothetical protein I4U23_015524 [Adineta vaga]|nr:hypothetical protein I4U23_015524 [Adineta vaga]